MMEIEVVMTDVVVMTDAVETIGVDETIDEDVRIGVDVLETIDVDETIGVIIAGLSKILIQETIGFVVNVETQTSHLEQSVTDVAPQKVEGNHPHGNGKAMTEGPVTEDKSHSQELVIGNVLNVENLTLQNETNASDVAAQRESVDQSREAIIVN